MSALASLRRALAAGVVLLSLSAAPFAAAQTPAEAPAPADPRQAHVKQELEYIQLLQTYLRLPDFADLVIQDLKKKYPEAEVQLRVAEIEGLLLQGKFEDVKKIIAKRADTDSPETWAMKLKLADYYFAYGRYGEAAGLYDAFFKRYETPPPELAVFYRDSAYKFTQMMMLLKQDKQALDGYRRMLKQKLEKPVERQVRAEMAELMVRVAEDGTKDDRDKLLPEADKTVDALLWELDLWFGKAVVLKAHIKLIQGKIDDAQRMIESYMPQLKEIHDTLVKEEKEQGTPGLVRLSPMAECRYLLGMMLLNESRKQMKAASYDPEKVKTLLFGAKLANGGRTGNGAFNHFINVFVQYPESQWAADAGERADEIKDLAMKTWGVKIDVPITREHWERMRGRQFAEARVLFNQNHFEEAIEALLTAVNRYPDVPETIGAIGDLVRCYIERSGDMGAEMSALYADMGAGHLAERFGASRELQESAGNEMLRLAEYYGERKMDLKRKQMYDLYLRNFRDHSLVPSTLVRFGEQAFQQQDYGTALGHFRQVAQAYSNSPLYFDALNRIAEIHEKSESFTNAIAVLEQFVRDTEARGRPGPALLAARFRLAAAHKNMAQSLQQSGGETNDPAGVARDLAQAAQVFDQIVKALSDTNSPFARTAEDRDRNAPLLESAIFNRAYCLQLIKLPAEKVPDLRRLAVEGYLDLARRFPKSRYAPGALMQAGMIRSVGGDSSGASDVFERLRKEHPDSPEAKNVLFEMGRRFLDMGLRAQGVDAFKKMFTEEGTYSDAQVLMAGEELLKAKQYDLASEAFDRVAARSKDPAVRTTAQLDKAQVQIAQEQYAAAVPALTALTNALKGTRRLLDANLLLSRAASEMGMREPSAEKRLVLFNTAVTAMRTIKTYRTNLIERLGTDLEVGRLLVRKARAEEKFGTPAKARDMFGQAVNSYHMLLLGADPSNAALGPLIEDAYHESVPLSLETKQWKDAIDDCNAYLDAFPGGRYALEMKNWKNQAGIEIGPGAVTPAPKPPPPPPGAPPAPPPATPPPATPPPATPTPATPAP
jgi:TolA-binding protein